MIEILVVIVVGFALIWLVRASRKANKEISKMSGLELQNFKKTIDINPKRYFVWAGSVTKVSGWVFVLIILFSGGVIYYAINNIS